MATVSVTVPATSSNLGPGFDSMALALGLHNIVELSDTEAGLSVEVAGEGANRLPHDAGNLAVRAAAAIFRRAGLAPGGLAVHIESNIPPGVGLGSSATALVGGAMAANVLIGCPLSRDEVLRAAIQIEGHPEAATAALFGGLVISSSDGGDLVYTGVPIAALHVAIAVPATEIDGSRASLPQEVLLTDAALNIGRAALVVQALSRGDYDLLERAMHDCLHEPARSRQIPGYGHAVEAARRYGAKAVAISGAGPALIAFAPDNHEQIAEAMARALHDAGGGDVRTWVLAHDTQGISISESGTQVTQGDRPIPASGQPAPPPDCHQRHPVRQPYPDLQRSL